MNKSYLKKLLFAGILGFSLFVFAPAVSAQPTEYQLLAPIPLDGASGNATEKTDTSKFLPGLFKLVIGIATGLSVVMIMYGGIQYMTTDAWDHKSSAKDTINNAIMGLLLAIAAWTILYTINPDLVNINLTIPRQEIASTTKTSSTPWSSGIGSGSRPTDSLALTHAQASAQFSSAGVEIAGAIKLAGIRQIIVDEVISLKSLCNCDVVITSATGGSHNEGQCSHSNGYKVDLRNKAEGIQLTDYIQKNFTPLPTRGDGAKMYKSPSGALYGLESNHWDVVKCN